MSSELEIRGIVDAHAAAVGRGDAEAMLSHIADDVLVFDVVEPLVAVAVNPCDNVRPSGCRLTTLRLPGRIAT